MAERYAIALPRLHFPLVREIEYQLRHRFCPWQDVAHIGIRRSGLPGREELKIVVTRTDGRPLKLAAPRDYTAAPDPGFPQAFHEIVQRWRTATNPYRRPSP